VWWFKHVIWANQEAEIRKITEPGQTGQKVCKIPSQPMARWGGMHLSLQLHQKAWIGDCGLGYLKNNQCKKECLASSRPWVQTTTTPEKDFITWLRKTCNLKLLNCVFLEFCISVTRGYFCNVEHIITILPKIHVPKYLPERNINLYLHKDFYVKVY
jgi:hypothetical protein